MSGKAKTKKPSDMQSEMTKCVFLHGFPNAEKLNCLQEIQSNYALEVNRFIRLIDSEDSLLPELAKNDHKASITRAYEKKHRSGILTSAYSQSAFDMAMDHLYNRFNAIRQELYGIIPCPLTASKILFAAALQNQPLESMQALLDEIIAKQEKGSYYKKLKDELAAMPDFSFTRKEIQTMYVFLRNEYKLPEVRHPRVRLVSTLYKLESSTDIAAPYVISIADPQNRGKMICVPLYASEYGKRRLEQYGRCQTVDYTITEDGKIRVAVAFKKRIKQIEPTAYRGVDVGITDMLFTSDRKAFGTFSDCLDFYKEYVEPSFAVMNGIRNKKRCLKAFLKKHKASLAEETVRSIRQKMDRLDVMLRTMRKPYHKRNAYQNMQEHAIKEAVNAYIASLNHDKSICTVVELLDIKEFESACRRKNQQLSNFARGKLSQKLMETLNWHGYSFKQVDPAYTSQSCPACSYVDKENRSGKQFRCLNCGYADDADYVGARNILSRATDTEIENVCTSFRYNKSKRHSEIMKVLTARQKAYQTEYMAGAYI